MTHLIRLAARFRFPVLVVLLALTALFATQLDKLRLYASFDKMMLDGDAARAEFEVFRQVFGESESILVFVHDPDLYTSGQLEMARQLAQALAALPYVRNVTSPFSLQDSSLLPDGEIQLSPYLPSGEPFAGRADLDDWLRKTSRDPLLADRFVTTDGYGMAILAELDEQDPGPVRDAGIAADLATLTAPLAESADILIATGPPLLRHEVNLKVLKDQQTLLPAAFALLLLLLAVSMRSINGALVPFLTGIASIVWTLGGMALVGLDLNVMTALVPLLLIIVGSTEDIHLLNEYQAARRDGLDNAAAIERMGSGVGKAVLLTFLTTAAGFLSIAVNPIALLQEFGLVAGFGLAANFLITTLLVPAWLSIFPARRENPHQSTRKPGVIPAVALTLMNWSTESRRLVLLLLAAFLVVAGAGAVQVRVDNNPLGYFEAKDRVVRDQAVLDERLAGSHTFSVMLDARIEETFLQVRYLRLLAAIQRHIAESGQFRTSFSFADIMAKTSSVIEGDDGDRYYLPDEDDIAREYALFLNRADIAPYISEDYSRARIAVYHTIQGSHDLGIALQQLEAHLKGTLPRGISVTITGHEVMTNLAADHMAFGQVLSLLLVFGVIWGLVSTLFVNFRAGVIAILPNLVPIAALFGIMGWTGIALDTSTAMVAAIAVGICIDDTLHFMVRFHENHSGRSSHVEALRLTVMHEARPIFSTSIALAAGFGLLALSGFPPVVNFGLLSAMMILAALTSTFLVAPLLLARSRLVSLLDVLDLKLQDQVRNRCELFADMRTWQIKKLVLMSEVRDYAAGATLFHQDEEGEELFVVLSGEIDIWRLDNKGFNFRDRCREGDVFGEMALVQQRPRSASAIAFSNSRILVMRWSDVRRIHHVYPRIATRFFLNLSRVLGERFNTAANN